MHESKYIHIHTHLSIWWTGRLPFSLQLNGLNTLVDVVCPLWLGLGEWVRVMWVLSDGIGFWGGRLWPLHTREAIGSVEVLVASDWVSGQFNGYSLWQVEESNYLTFVSTHHTYSRCKKTLHAIRKSVQGAILRASHGEFCFPEWVCWFKNLHIHWWLHSSHEIKWWKLAL